MWLNTMQGFYFLVEPKQRCFTIDLPRDTPMVFSYDILDIEHSLELNMYYGLEPNTDLKIQMKKIHKSGHIDFNADNDGDYALCVNQADVYDVPTVRFHHT
jgi:hypothetical protein